jgi:hypothetical protein
MFGAKVLALDLLRLSSFFDGVEKMKRVFAGTCVAILLIASVISGCASAPSAEQIANADYGREMSPEECQSIVESVIAFGLKDPGSAQFRHQPCVKGWWNSVPILDMSVAFGYWQKGEVNAKNSFGGYVGFRTYSALLRNGAVVRICVSDEDGLCFPKGQ